MAGSRLPDGGGESHHFRGNQNPGPGRLPAPAAPQASGLFLFALILGLTQALLLHLLSPAFLPVALLSWAHMDRTTNGLPWAVSRKLLVRQRLPLPVWFQPLGGQLALSPLLFLIHPPAPYHFRGKPPFRGIWTFWNSSHNSQQPAIHCLQKAGS